MPRSIRVLNIMLARVRGGVETMALMYHRGLKSQGFDVISAGHPDGVLAENLSSSEVALVAARFNLDPVAICQLATLQREFRPDIVLTHGNRAAGLALNAFMPSRDRVVCVLHNEFFKAHLKRCRSALCVSSSVQAAARIYMPNVPSYFMPNFSVLETGELRNRLPTQPVIAALGRLHAQKGFDILINAAAKLRDTGLDFRLVIGGDGEEAAALRRQVESLNLSDHVVFQGWIDDRPAFLAQADLMVVPSRYEPFGLVVIEAMAAGVPVIASDLEGPHEILDRGRLGTVVPAENAPALAAVLQSVLEHYPKACETAVIAQQEAVATYGFDAGAERLARAVHALCAPAP